jgi:carbon monoxide dehydrogenase subunit G
VKLEHSFDVEAPVQRVWEALIDVEYVAPCLPGAAVTGRDDDGSYRGTFTVKLGPTTAAYNGVLRIGEVDEASHRATLHARGTDKRGQGGATATIVNTVTELAPTSTRVQAETDFVITGRLARFGRGGMMEDISNRLLQEFSRCLQSKLAAEEAAQASEIAASGAAETESASSADVPPAPSGPAPITPAAPAPPPQSAPPPGAPPRPPGATAPRPVTAAPSAKPVNGLTLFLSVIWKRLKARFSAGRKAP